MKSCKKCEHMATYYTKDFTDYLRICTVDEPEEEDGIFLYAEVGNGNHPDCLMWGEVK